MIQNITLGQYFPGNSFLHRLDPRMKLLLTLALIIIVFFVKGIAGYVLLYGLIIGCAALSHISPKFLIKGMKPILFIIVLTFLLNALFSSGSTVWWSFGFFSITKEGVLNAVFMALRLVFLMVCTQADDAHHIADCADRGSGSAAEALAEDRLPGSRAGDDDVHRAALHTYIDGRNRQDNEGSGRARRRL